MFEQTLFYNQLKKESLEKKILLMIRLIMETGKSKSDTGEEKFPLIE